MRPSSLVKFCLVELEETCIIEAGQTMDATPKHTFTRPLGGVKFQYHDQYMYVNKELAQINKK